MISGVEMAYMNGKPSMYGVRKGTQKSITWDHARKERVLHLAFLCHEDGILDRIIMSSQCKTEFFDSPKPAKTQAYPVSSSSCRN
jgi:hypothetical protein